MLTMKVISRTNITSVFEVTQAGLDHNDKETESVYAVKADGSSTTYVGADFSAAYVMNEAGKTILAHSFRPCEPNPRISKKK